MLALEHLVGTHGPITIRLINRPAKRSAAPEAKLLIQLPRHGGAGEQLKEWGYRFDGQGWSQLRQRITPHQLQRQLQELTLLLQQSPPPPPPPPPTTPPLPTLTAKEPREALIIEAQPDGIKVWTPLRQSDWPYLHPYAFFVKKRPEDTQLLIDDVILITEITPRRGWMYRLSVIPLLLHLGYQPYLLGIPVSHADDLHPILTSHHPPSPATKSEWQAFISRQIAAQQAFEACCQWERVPYEETTDLLRARPLILPDLDWTGPTHTGQGRWGRMDLHYLYRIDQNDHESNIEESSNSVEGLVYRTPLCYDLLEQINRLQPRNQLG